MFPGISSQIFLREKLSDYHAASVREAGFQAIEIYGFAPHFDCASAEHARAVGKAFANEGVAISALHAPFYEHGKAGNESRWLSISSTNDKTRRMAIDKVERCVESAIMLNTSIIVIHFGSSGDKNTHEAISNLFSSLVHIESIMRGTGVRSAYENIGTPVSLCGYIGHFLEKYEFRNAGMCIDLGHANINEDPTSAVVRCAHLLLNVHASDNSGNSDSHDIPFLGNVKWGDVCRALLEAEYSGSFTMEPRFYGDPFIMLKTLREAYDAVLRAAEDG